MLMKDVPTWKKEILPIVLPSMVEAENFSYHPLSYEGLTFYGASLYSPIDRDIERDFETVEKIIQLAKGKGLILSIDSKSRSTLWYDTSTNQRGKSLEEFIITSNLLIMNKATDIPTFETSRAAFLKLFSSGDHFH